VPAAKPIEYRRLFEGAPALLLVLAPDPPRYTILDATDAYLRATGTERARIAGFGIFEVFPDNPDDLAASGVRNLRASLDRVVESRSPDAMAVQKYDIPRPGEGRFEERYWSPVNVPVLSPAGEIEWIVHRVEDVTAFVGGEAASVRAGLEILGRSRELDAANRQLRVLNEELEAFSYSVSHDLRAPVRHILAFLQLLLRTAAPKLDEKERHYLDTVRRAAERAAELIEDLLAFARMARVGTTPASLDLRVLVDEVRSSLVADSGLAARARFTVGSLPTVRADPGLLRVVLINLLSNALKYARDRSPPEIEVGGVPQPDGGIAVFVRDNGVGFDMAHRDKLFAPFQRLHSSSQFEGTGLGLATVRRIVMRHGGDVWAAGDVGRGATFWFSFPAAAIVRAPADAPGAGDGPEVIQA
jgi:signal transduction histidine kinase